MAFNLTNTGVGPPTHRVGTFALSATVGHCTEVILPGGCGRITVQFETGEGLVSIEGTDGHAMGAHRFVVPTGSMGLDIPIAGQVTSIYVAADVSGAKCSVWAVALEHV